MTKVASQIGARAALHENKLAGGSRKQAATKPFAASVGGQRRCQLLSEIAERSRKIAKVHKSTAQWKASLQCEKASRKSWVELQQRRIASLPSDLSNMQSWESMVSRRLARSADNLRYFYIHR